MAFNPFDPVLNPFGQPMPFGPPNLFGPPNPFSATPFFAPPPPNPWLMGGGNGLPFGGPPPDHLRIFYGLDPKRDGNTKYVYRTPGQSGPPMQGRTPGNMQQAQGTGGVFPMAPTNFMAPICPLTQAPAAQFNPCSREMNRSPSPPAPRNLGGYYNVRYFSDAVNQLYNAKGKSRYSVPKKQQTDGVHEKRFAPGTTIEQLILELKCKKRAEKYGSCVPGEIGIQEVLSTEDGEIEVGQKIFLTSDEAQEKISEVFKNPGRQIWVVRLPVCKYSLL